MSDPVSKTTNQARIRSKPDIEQAAIELWMQTKNDSSDWSWDAILPIRKEAYRRMAVAVLSAAGCLNGLRRGQH